MSATKALHEVVEHLARREDTAAIDGLLAAWAAVGAPAIAELLDLVILRVHRHGDWVPPAARGWGWPNHAWLRIAADLKPADLDDLLSDFASHRETSVRLRTLCEFPPDPRMVRVVSLFSSSVYYDEETYLAACDVLEHARDPRVLPILATSVEPTTGYDPSRLLFWARTAHERLEKAFTERRTALTTDEQRLVSEVERQLADVARLERERSEWLGRIAEDPTDLSIRHVFADWLEEQGDRAGPYMSRALNDDSDPPPALDTDRWLGALAGAIRVTARKNGLPSRCSTTSSLSRTIGAAAWSTVEELALGNVRDADSILADVLLHPMMRSLRVVSLKASLAELLVKRAPHGLSRMMLIITDAIPSSFLASLHELQLDGIGGPVVPEDIAVALSLRVRRLELSLKVPVEYKISLERDDRGLWTKLEVDFPQYVTQAAMLDTFRGIPDGSLVSVAITMAPRYTGTTEARPLPLKQTHGPTLASRFPRAKTEIRSG